MNAPQLPSFLIVGAAKSGTSSLAAWLGEHPQAFVPDAKELYFFEHDERWARGAGWYREQFAEAGDAVAVGEATPNYMFLADGASRMASVVPEARLIALLREPGERAHSHYWHWRKRKRRRERRSFEEAAREELARPRRAFEDPADRLDPQYLARGRYLPQLERLCEHYRRENVLVLLLDDLERRPVETFERVCRFLGIEELVGESVGRPYNEAFSFRPEPLARVMGALRIGKFLPDRLGAVVFHGMRRVEANPPMAPGVRAALTDHFAPENEALAEWLGRDLAMWSID